MKKFLCIAMCFVLCLSMTLPCYAASNPSSEEETIWEGDNFIITGSVTADGTTILNEYTDGVLTQRNTVYANDPDHAVYIEHFGSGIARTAQREVIYATDYGTIETHDSVSPCLATIAGRIYYRTPDPSYTDGFFHYSVFCQYTTSDSKQTTYTVRNYTGQITNLVSLFVSALKSPAAFVSTFIRRLITNLCLKVAGDVLVDSFTATVAALRTDYDWQMMDPDNYSNYHTAKGSKYYINDTGSHYGENYYDGFVPQQWRTQYFAVQAHGLMFGYDVFEVEKWG